MSDTVIRVENLSKRYVINHQRTSGDGLRHVLQDKIAAPWRALRASLSGKSQVEENSVPLNFNLTSSTPSSQGDEEFWALRDVSFEVNQGEVLGVIGRNGAGKSTLLKIMSRITEPTSGSISIEGRVASLLEVGTGFHPELTGRENIFLNGAILGMSRSEVRSKFDEIVAFAEIERFLDTPVKRYSSGMYVRLAFAVAAHLEPEILVVDEVLAVGDAAFQKKCLGKMRDVSRSGRTVLFVSHNMAVVSALCSRAILLSSGRVAFAGVAEEAIKTYIAQSSARMSASVDLNRPEFAHLGAGSYARILKLGLFNRDGSLASTLRMGEPASLQLEIDIRRPSDDFEIGIAMNNLYDVSLHYLVSGWEGFSAIRRTGLHIITVKVPYVYLFPGDYQLNVWIAVRGAYYDDAVHEALRFRVEEGPVNGHETYFARFSKNTQVYLPSEWSCVEEKRYD